MELYMKKGTKQNVDNYCIKQTKFIFFTLPKNPECLCLCLKSGQMHISAMAVPQHNNCNHEESIVKKDCLPVLDIGSLHKALPFSSSWANFSVDSAFI